MNEFATVIEVRIVRMEKFGGVVSVSAESLALMRRYRSLGVVWAIFSLCYNIILWVVITQVRLGVDSDHSDDRNDHSDNIIVMVMIVMMLHHPVDSDHPGEEITTSCPASSIG